MDRVQRLCVVLVGVLRCDWGMLRWCGVVGCTFALWPTLSWTMGWTA